MFSKERLVTFPMVTTSFSRKKKWPWEEEET